MATNNPQQKKDSDPTESKERQSGVFVVEVDPGQNRTYLSATFQTPWRGSFSLDNIERGHNVGNIMANMKPFPGLRIRLDISKARVEIFDPITKAQLDAVNRVLNDPNSGPVRTDAKTIAVESVEHDLSEDANKFKTFLLEVRQCLDEGIFKPISGGDFPTKDQIAKLPGRQFNDPFNSSAIKPKYADEQENYMRQLQRQD